MRLNGNDDTVADFRHYVESFIFLLNCKYVDIYIYVHTRVCVYICFVFM